MASCLYLVLTQVHVRRQCHEESCILAAAIRRLRTASRSVRLTTSATPLGLSCGSHATRQRYPARCTSRRSRWWRQAAGAPVNPWRRGQPQRSDVSRGGTSQCQRQSRTAIAMINVNRNVNRQRPANVNRGRWGGWARPGYRWGPGGAIAAGAALGFVGRRGQRPPGLAPPRVRACAGITPTQARTQGFWDACPLKSRVIQSRENEKRRRACRHGGAIAFEALDFDQRRWR